MDDIFVYLVDMPHRIGEFVVPCNGGYTVYINALLTYEQQIRAYQHALDHIRRDDLSTENADRCADEIESEAHRKGA